MKYICRIFAVALAAFAVSAHCAARQLTVDEAIGRAAQSHRHLARSATSGANTLAYQAVADGSQLYYVVNRSDESGFMILSADDTFLPVIAYSPEGSFDINDIPDGLRWYLSTVEANIAAAIAEGTPATKRRVPAGRQTPIPNLVTSKWNQFAPFNNHAPMDGTSRSVTGCVATAMAQVMYSHKHPAQGTGQHSYTWKGNTLSADFGATTYQWDQMQDKYFGNYTTEQADIVAQLNYHCGVSVDMIYSSGASAANIFKVPNAMHTYFGYDDGIRIEHRLIYSSEEWTQMIYDELAAGCPVLYSGSDATSGGHYFICTGCDGNDEYYINWGWQNGNAYYSLDALDPPGLYSYNIDQSILTGVKPDDNVPVESTFNMLGRGELKIYYKDFGKVYDRRSNSTQYLWPNGSPAGFFSYDWKNSVSKLGVIFADAETDEIVSYAEQYSAIETSSTYKLSQAWMAFDIRDTSFPQSGTYKMYPAALGADGQWHKIPFDKSSPQYLIVECTPTTFKFEKPTEGLPILEAQLNLPKYTQGYTAKLPLTITNSGTAEYSGDISIYSKHELVKDNMWNLSTSPIILAPGETKDVNVTFQARKISTQADGVYIVYIQDKLGNMLVPHFKVVVNGNEAVELAIASQPTVTVTKITSPAQRSRAGEQANVDISIPVECTHGFYYGPVTAEIVNKADNSVAAKIEGTESKSVYPDETVTYNLSGKMPYEDGNYAVKLSHLDDYGYPTSMTGHDAYSDDLNFSVLTPTGIGELEADSLKAVIYNAEGMRLGCDESALPAGLYIRVIGSKTEKIIIR